MNEKAIFRKLNRQTGEWEPYDFGIERDSQIVRLPFKYGDIIFMASRFDYVREMVVHGYYLSEDSILIDVGGSEFVNIDNIGKTIFDDYEEAMAKLVEMRVKNKEME